MKINSQILSIPPYISTSWKNVLSLHCSEEDQGKVLVITLVSGSTIEIPHLPDALLKQIFLAHSHSIDQQTGPTKEVSSLSKIDALLTNGDNVLTFGFPLKLNGLDAASGFSTMMHHNQEMANSPELPKEVIDKIKAITHALGVDQQLESLPKAEPHCNCPFCQLARAIHNPPEETSPKEVETLVSDADLTFREWDIKQVDDKLYDVKNPLDSNEHYQVYLGKPIGCTCGHDHCQHIKAVLSS